jgi:large subunit ribosomal protein L6
MLKTQLHKSLKLNSDLKVSLVSIRETKILVFNNSNKYFVIPLGVDCCVKKDLLLLSTKEKNKRSKTALCLFYSLVSEYLKTFGTITKKVLKLKGLGFRISILSPNLLEFKLGFSHLKVLTFSLDNLKVSVSKNMLFVEGKDRVLVGNFAEKIRALKLPDIYKGKGFWYKYQKESLYQLSQAKL